MSLKSSRVTQVVAHLPSKHESLSSTPSAIDDNNDNNDKLWSL
jgi:hypothetical protein